MTQEEINAKQRLSRKANNYLYTKRYEKTKKGFLVRLYRNMKSRITGVQRTKLHLYEGKYLLDKDEFYCWALESDAFNNLFRNWEESDYERRLTPSVDRVDSTKGYIMKNMEWVPFHENCRRGAQSRCGKMVLPTKCEVVS